MLHRVAHPRQETHAGGEVEAPAAGVLVQGQSVDELHREEWLAVVGEAGLVDLRDAGVMQPAQNLGLVGEPLDDGGGGEAEADDLEGHDAAWAILLRLVDGAHAALANDFQHLVMPQPAERARPLGGGQEVERDAGFSPHRRCLARTRSTTNGRHAVRRRELLCRRHVQEVARLRMRLEQRLDASCKSESPSQACSRKAARRAGPSFSIASKKIARSPIALLYSRGCRGRGSRCSVPTMPPVGHCLPTRNRGRNHATLIRARCDSYFLRSRAWYNQALE